MSNRPTRRFYHDGGTLHAVPYIDHPTLGRAVKVPPMFWKQTLPRKEADGSITWVPVPEYRELPEQSIAVSFAGEGFWVVPPGGFVDLPDNITTKMVKEAAPHLLSQEEYDARNPAPAPSKKSK